MTDSMKAIVYHGPKDIRLESIAPLLAFARKQGGDDEIRVKVDACAVYGTNLKTHLYGNPRIKAT